MIPTVQDPAVAGLRRQVEDLREQRDRAVREADDERRRAETLRSARNQAQRQRDELAREVQALRQTSDSWHTIAETVDLLDDGVIDIGTALERIREQVGER